LGVRDLCILILPKKSRSGNCHFFLGEVVLLGDGEFNLKLRTLREETFTVFDLETTGGRPESNGILEIGLVKIKENRLVERYSTLVKPGFPIPPIVKGMTGIDEEMVAGAPDFGAIAKLVFDFIDSDVLVVHNSPFDVQFLNYHLQRANLAPLHNPALCTVKLGHRLLPEARNRKLETLAEHLGISMAKRHRAPEDAEATAKIFLHYLEKLEGLGVGTLSDLIRWVKKTPEPHFASKKETDTAIVEDDAPGRSKD